LNSEYVNVLKLLRNGRILDPQMRIAPGDLLIENDSILQIFAPGEKPTRNIDIDIDLRGYLIFPGLLNAHDHLVDSFPYESPGTHESPDSHQSPERACQTWHEWEAEFKKSKAREQMQKLSAADLYSLGIYRNILSGVTLVSDHFPREIATTFMGMPQITLLENYFLAHSVSAQRHEWGQGIQKEFSQSRGLLPFIVHLGEGFSQELIEECENLNRLGALGENTVLINALNLGPAQIEMVASRKASVVWCPCSCAAVFRSQPPIERFLDSNIRIAIGTDRALASPGILFDNLREARRFSREKLNGRLTDEALIRMATSIPAEMLGVDKASGSLAPGKLANLLVFEDTLQNPMESFFSLKTGTIGMVLHKGGLVYGDERFRSLCTLDSSQYTEILADDRPKILMGRPFQLLDRIENKLEQVVCFPFLPLAPGK